MVTLRSDGKTQVTIDYVKMVEVQRTPHEVRRDSDKFLEGMQDALGRRRPCEGGSRTLDMRRHPQCVVRVVQEDEEAPGVVKDLEPGVGIQARRIEERH